MSSGKFHWTKYVLSKWYVYVSSHPRSQTDRDSALPDPPKLGPLC